MLGGGVCFNAYMSERIGSGSQFREAFGKASGRISAEEIVDATGKGLGVKEGEAWPTPGEVFTNEESRHDFDLILQKMTTEDAKLFQQRLETIAATAEEFGDKPIDSKTRQQIMAQIQDETAFKVYVGGPIGALLGYVIARELGMDFDPQTYNGAFLMTALGAVSGGAIADAFLKAAKSFRSNFEKRRGEKPYPDPSSTLSGAM